MKSLQELALFKYRLPGDCTRQVTDSFFSPRTGKKWREIGLAANYRELGLGGAERRLLGGASVDCLPSLVMLLTFPL